jgi:hypothetical protein
MNPEFVSIPQIVACATKEKLKKSKRREEKRREEKRREEKRISFS